MHHYGALWCIVVQLLGGPILFSGGTRRISVSFSPGHYKALQRIANEKRVSLAWVVRDAVRVYVEADSPLTNEIRNQKGRENDTT